MNDDSAYRSLLLYDQDARSMFYECDPLLKAQREGRVFDDPHIVEVIEPEDITKTAAEQFYSMMTEKVQKAVRQAIAQGEVTSEDMTASMPTLAEVFEQAPCLPLEKVLEQATDSTFLYASTKAFEKLANKESIQKVTPRFALYNGISLFENEFLESEYLLLLDLNDFKLSESLQNYTRNKEEVRYVWRGKLECLAPEKQIIVAF